MIGSRNLRATTARPGSPWFTSPRALPPRVRLGKVGNARYEQEKEGIEERDVRCRWWDSCSAGIAAFKAVEALKTSLENVITITLTAAFLDFAQLRAWSIWIDLSCSFPATTSRSSWFLSHPKKGGGCEPELSYILESYRLPKCCECY